MERGGPRGALRGLEQVLSRGADPRESLLRPAIHAGTGLLGLTLGALPYAGAIGCALLGVVAGWIVFPLTPLEARLRRPGEPFLAGLRTYPLAVLALVVALPPAQAAAGWAVLAFGDTAAGVVGQRVGSPSLLGHPKATWAGTAAGLAAGAVAAALLAWGVGALAPVAGIVKAGCVPGPAVCLAASAAGTLATLVPVPPDDNLPCALAAGFTLHLLGAGGGI